MFSVLARLNNLASESGKTHQYLITRFAQERYLYRLSTGQHRERFVLKGGLLLTAMTDQFYRATRYIDVGVVLENDPQQAHTLVIEAISHDVADDGLTFLTDMIKLATIKSNDEKHALRLTMTALVGKARTLNQMDMAFDDLVVLPRNEFD